MTLITLAVVFAYFSYPKENGRSNVGGGRFAWLKSYGTWRSLVLVASAVPIAIITNAGRVSGTGILSRYYGTKVADGFFHEFSGWVVYIAAFLLLFATGWLLDKLASLKHRRAPREGEAARAGMKGDLVKESAPVVAAVTPAAAPGGDGA